MPRHTVAEWWVIYCLRYGPDSIRTDSWLDGEQEFVDTVAEDLGLLGDWRRGSVISKFRDLRKQETRAGSNPH